ncbi:hypothetical protein K435DRAFT_851860 [Dendrothele bispora CBS 962.96]|uniref:FAD/NAD(P)-binding domain-containing protein n=1 Tax=Dendrothele bispora (strain CBS 962.96) TaxID=1314807 RepID=A0A4S8MKS8_DENBC|nr:hypothetical protein K435DRAFT_851860 [Dendrothele bispora CBS 962.96]
MVRQFVTVAVSSRSLTPRKKCHIATLIKGALRGYAIQLSINFYDAGGGATMFSCDLDPPNFNSNSDVDLDLHAQCVQSGYSIIMHTISSFPTTTTSTSSSTQTISGSNADFATNAALTTRSFILHRLSLPLLTALRSKFSFPTFNSRPGNQDTTTGSTMSPLTNRKVNESSHMHSEVVIIGSQPAIHLAQANPDSVLFEGLMANDFPAGGQRTATVNESLAPELMYKLRKQPLHFGTGIITEPISKIDLSHRPFRYWGEGQEDEELETADTVIVVTGASAKRLGLKGGEAYRHSGIRACVVCVGVVPIFRNEPPAVIGGCDSAAEEANYGHIVYVPGTDSNFCEKVFAAGDVQDKRYRQAITSAGVDVWLRLKQRG